MDTVVWAIGQDAFGAGPVLVFQIFHGAADHVLGADPADAAQWVLDMLAELGPDASAADGIEAFVAGAGLAPGAARRARQALRAPC